MPRTWWLAKCTLNLQQVCGEGWSSSFHLMCCLSYVPSLQANPLQRLVYHTWSECSASCAQAVTGPLLGRKTHNSDVTASLSTRSDTKDHLSLFPDRRQNHRPGEGMLPFSSCSRGDWTSGLTCCTGALNHWDRASSLILWVARLIWTHAVDYKALTLESSRVSLPATWDYRLEPSDLAHVGLPFLTMVYWRKLKLKSIWLKL